MKDGYIVFFSFLGLLVGVVVVIMTFACEVAVVLYATSLIKQNVEGYRKFMLVFGVWSLYVARLFYFWLFVTTKKHWS